MLEWLLPVKSIAMSSVGRAIIWLTRFRLDDPLTIKQRFYGVPALAFRSDYKDRLYNDQTDKTKASTTAQSRLGRHADWYRFRAQMHWGQASVREHLKSAWLYALAGYLFDLGGKTKDASNHYHFAANALRLVQAYQDSIELYIEAARLGEGAWRTRCYQRAIGVARLVGDDHEVAKLESMIRSDSPDAALSISAVKRPWMYPPSLPIPAHAETMEFDSDQQEERPKRKALQKRG